MDNSDTSIYHFRSASKHVPINHSIDQSINQSINLLKAKGPDDHLHNNIKREPFTRTQTYKQKYPLNTAYSCRDNRCGVNVQNSPV